MSGVFQCAKRRQARLQELLQLAEAGGVSRAVQLALRKVVDEDYDTAMELLLQLMQKDRGYGDDAGRLALLKVFELLGDDPRVGGYRRRMASLLY